MARSRYEYLLTIESKPLTKMQCRRYLHATLIPLDRLYYVKHNSKYFIVQKRDNIMIRNYHESLKQSIYFKNRQMLDLVKKHKWRVCAIEHLFKILYNTGRTRWKRK